ncbi:family 1 encapsulin nanocompartment shell protein [Embleya sp. MST-111070]|uniref:family 1 encapsulin nanocompartment shell protein n=1 Tax=Embleya sp. MST-111070 TaxID=3398231 RepID=UPI003F7391C7
MNNLHRELAPISDAAWADLEDEARRTFKQHVAGRRVVDVTGPDGSAAAGVGTGHLTDLEPPADGVLARSRRSRPLIELRVPFTVARSAVDAVERGAADADWQPVKDAARKMGFTEDRLIFEGYPAASIEGIRRASTNVPVSLPTDARDYPDAVSRALTELRLAGVNGPYHLVLGPEAYTAVNEAADHGYPIRQHLTRILAGEPIWAPAIDGAFVLSTRGGDYELRLGQDLSIGYLSHDDAGIHLYFQETLTFLMYTGEAAIGFARP